jgi:lambda family phage portal protein
MKAKKMASKRASTKKVSTRRSVSAERSARQLLGTLHAQLLQDIQANAGGGITVPRAETRWRGASRTLRTMVGWQPPMTGGRTDTPKNERDTLTTRSHDAHKNHLVARAVVGRLRTNVVGTGLVMHPDLDETALGISPEDADTLKQTITSEWRLFFDNPREVDLESSLDGSGLQALAWMSSYLSGDCWALTPFRERMGGIYGLKVQLIDAARVSNPNDSMDTQTLQDGVEITPEGEPIAVYIRNQHPGDRTVGTLPAWDRREIFSGESGRRRVLQVWNDKDRIGMTRGIPGLAPILEPLQTLEQYSRAELLAAVVSSMFTVFIKKQAQQFDERGNPLPVVEGTTAKGEAVGMELGPGAVLDMAPGEEAQFANPSRPNANYDPFFLSVVTQISAALELPVDEVLLRYTQSYSAARAAMLQAWRYYTMRRWWLVQQFCQPLYELWFDEAVARGRIPVTDYATNPVRRAAYTRAIWIGPARGAMDETQEANAAATRIEKGLSNEMIEVAAMQGESWESVYRQRMREINRRKADDMMTGPAPGQAANPNQPGGPGAPADPRRRPPDPNRPPPAEPPAEPETDEEEEAEAESA